MKEPFEYRFTRPCLDWFEYVPVNLNWDDYCYYRLERRFGPSWWIIGMNPCETPNYHWEDKQIGSIEKRDLLRFIEWAKDNSGSKIIEVKMISGSFDVFKEIQELLEKPKELVFNKEGL